MGVVVHHTAAVVRHIAGAVAAEVADHIAAAAAAAGRIGHTAASHLAEAVAAAGAVVVGSNQVDSSFVHLPGCNLHLHLLFDLLQSFLW